MGGAGMVFFVKCWDRILFIHSFSFNHLQVGGAGMVFFEWGVEIEFCSSTHYLLFISRSSFPDVVVPFPDPDVVVAHLHFTIHFFLAFFWWYYISEWPFYLIFLFVVIHSSQDSLPRINPSCVDALDYRKIFWYSIQEVMPGFNALHTKRGNTRGDHSQEYSFSADHSQEY